MVIKVPKEDFRCPVVPTLNVEEATLAVLATGSKINKFDWVHLIVIKKYVFWFHVAMDHFLILHKFEALDNLVANGLELVRREDFFLPFIIFHVVVQVKVQVFEHDDYVLSEFKRVSHLDDPVGAFGVLWLVNGI